MKKILKQFLRIFEWYRNEEYYAHHDELTGALRRWSIIEILKEWERSRKRFAVIYVDFDDFKPVNDTYGHAVGDGLLVHFVALVNDYLAGEDYHVGRMGGDEFLVVIQADGYGHPESVAQGLEMKCVDTPYLLPNSDHKEIEFAISAGYAIYSGDIDLTIQQADRQLYFTKGNKQKRRVRHREGTE